MNIKYTITFGTELNKDGSAVVLTEYDHGRITTVLESIAKEFGGYTHKTHSGGYLHEDGSLAIEKSESIEILVEENLSTQSKIATIARQFKSIYNQESVMVTKQKLEMVSFI